MPGNNSNNSNNEERNPALVEEGVPNYGLPGNWVEVDAVPINPNTPRTRPPVPVPTGVDSYGSGPLPPNFGLQPALVKTGYPATTGPIPLMPVSPGNNPQFGAAIRSTVENVVNNSTVVQDIVDSSPTTTAVNQAPFTNSTLIANTSYVDGEIFYNPGITGFRDDFLAVPSGGVGSGGASYTSAGQIQFDTVWGYSCQTSSASHGEIVPGQGSDNSHIGTIQIYSQAGSGQGIILAKSFWIQSLGSLYCSFPAFGSFAPWQMDFIVAPGVGSPLTEYGCFRAGLAVGGTGTPLAIADPPVAGMWVRYDTAAGDATDGLFVFECRSNTTGESTTSTKNSLSAANPGFAHFRIFSVTPGQIAFTVNGGAPAVISSNVDPVYSMFPFFQVLTRTGGSASLNLDFVSLVMSTNRI
jgi:hypothetical protein